MGISPREPATGVLPVFLQTLSSREEFLSALDGVKNFSSANELTDKDGTYCLDS